MVRTSEWCEIATEYRKNAVYKPLFFRTPIITQNVTMVARLISEHGLADNCITLCLIKHGSRNLAPPVSEFYFILNMYTMTPTAVVTCHLSGWHLDSIMYV